MQCLNKDNTWLSPNIAIKCPALPAGIKAMEMLTAAGITVSATIGFTVLKAVQVAEAIERGLSQAEKTVLIQKMSHLMLQLWLEE